MTFIGLGVVVVVVEGVETVVVGVVVEGGEDSVVTEEELVGEDVDRTLVVSVLDVVDLDVVTVGVVPVVLVSSTATVERGTYISSFPSLTVSVVTVPDNRSNQKS